MFCGIIGGENIRQKERIMIFLEIELLSLPRIAFSYSVEISKYSHRFRNIPGFLEICLHETGTGECRYTDGSVRRELPGTLNCITYLDDVECASTGSGTNRHTTVGVYMAYTATEYGSEGECDVEALKARMKEKHVILIPRFEILDDVSDKIVSLIKSIGILYDSDDPAEKTMALSKWFSLTSLLSDYVLKRLDNTVSLLPPSEQMYTAKAAKFISENYQRRLTIEEISNYVGLSEGHLQRIFHRVKGVSVVEYVNTHRVKAVAELMTVQNISLKEAALNVGITDPAYMSRLFKKVTGLSCREYMRQKSKF